MSGFGTFGSGGFGSTSGKSGSGGGGFGTGATGGTGGFGSGGGGFGTGSSGSGGGGFGSTGGGGFGTGTTGGGGGFGSSGGGGFGTGSSGSGGGGGFGSGGFGSSSGTGGFGSSSGGFGSGTSGGFGSGGGGFGGSSGQQQQQTRYTVNNMHVAFQYLLQWDSVYNATHSDCKFRGFVYNVCPAGQGDQAVLYHKLNLRSAVPEEQWLLAKRNNPDPERLYPYPVHFFADLKTRAESQRTQIIEYNKRIKKLREKVQRLRSLQQDAMVQYKRLAVDNVLLCRHIVSVMAKMETLREHGLRLGSESTLGEKLQRLFQEVTSQKFLGTIEELRPLVEKRLADSARGRQGTSVDPVVVREWLTFLEGHEKGIRQLRSIVQNDLELAQLMRIRCQSRGVTLHSSLKLPMN